MSILTQLGVSSQEIISMGYPVELCNLLETQEVLMITPGFGINVEIQEVYQLAGDTFGIKGQISLNVLEGRLRQRDEEQGSFAKIFFSSALSPEKSAEWHNALFPRSVWFAENAEALAELRSSKKMKEYYSFIKEEVGNLWLTGTLLLIPYLGKNGDNFMLRARTLDFSGCELNGAGTSSFHNEVPLTRPNAGLSSVSIPSGIEVTPTLPITVSARG